MEEFRTRTSKFRAFSLFIPLSCLSLNLSLPHQDGNSSQGVCAAGVCVTSFTRTEQLCSHLVSFVKRKSLDSNCRRGHPEDVTTSSPRIRISSLSFCVKRPVLTAQLFLHSLTGMGRWLSTWPHQTSLLHVTVASRVFGDLRVRYTLITQSLVYVLPVRSGTPSSRTCFEVHRFSTPYRQAGCTFHIRKPGSVPQGTCT